MLRFAASERALHWGFALGYLLLLASGLPLMVPALRGWIRGYSPVIGLRLHLTSAALWVVVTLAIVVLGDRRRLRETWRDLVNFDRQDAVWLRRFPRWLFGRSVDRARLDATVGRFNAGQKANALFTLVTSGLLLLTGAALWPIDASGTALCALLTGPASVEHWREAHRWLTVLVLGPLAGHVFLATVYPSTRPALAGMLGGRVDPGWAATHHPRWCQDRGDETERV
jgi:formate dehydrogenase gamma subunit